MITVGEILQKKRIEKNLSYDEVEKKTKIRTKYLKALEKNDFKKLPPAPFVKGFIKNYSQFLDLNSQNLLAILRRDYDEDKSGQIIPRPIIQPLSQPKITWSPQITLIALLAVVFICLSLYFGWQYISFISPPYLKAKSPKKNEKITSQKITVSGETDKNATLSINGQVITLTEKGEFEKQIILQEGINNIIIESTKKNGKKTTLNLPVIVELPK